VRSYLVLNMPWQGTGTQSIWQFSGADDAALRKCLDQLDAYHVPDPLDRWSAAIAYGFPETAPLQPPVYSTWPSPHQGWAIAGALALAELLPERLEDLREALVETFSARAAGWSWDAHTTPKTH
jgi:hypothetical protein